MLATCFLTIWFYNLITIKKKKDIGTFKEKRSDEQVIALTGDQAIFVEDGKMGFI